MKARFAMSLMGVAGAAMFISHHAAWAQAIEVIYTKIPTHPTSIVPGALDATGNPAVTNFRAIDDLFLSPDGTRWVVRGRTQQGADLENILLIGSGTSGTMLLQEAQPVPASPGEVVDFFSSGIGRFNDNNEFALALRARNGSNTQYQKVLLYTGDTTPDPADWVLVGRGGNSPGVDLITGLQDVAPNPAGDETVGNSIGSIHLLNSGAIGAHDGTVNLIHTSRRPVLLYGGPDTARGGAYTFNGFKQVGVSQFFDLDGTPRIYASATGGLGSNSFYTTPDGTRWIVDGQILGAPSSANDVLVVDDHVKIKEDSAIPGSTALVHSIVVTQLLSNGDYYSRGLRRATPGGTTSDGVWAAINGALLAQTGDAIGTTGENWGATFLAFTGNTNGDWVLVGRSSNPDPAIDDVIVHNGEIVIREGDPIDLDGNGQFDDNVFIGRGNNTLSAFEPNDFALTDDGMLYFFANLRDGQGNDLNSDPAFVTPASFLRVNLAGPTQPPCPADIAPQPKPDGVVNVNDLLLVINTWGACPGDCPPSCPADITQDCSVNVNDLLAVINAWGDCPLK